jgi:DNA-binding CsgD family transcriptional regulator/tetratricopeptide (TPR) repeat protein
MTSVEFTIFLLGKWLITRCRGGPTSRICEVTGLGPDGLRSYDRGMLHGRQPECERVDGLLAAARAGRSGVLVLRGEAGIGKSALLRYAAEQADGTRVLRGTGVESESEYPFASLHHLLRPVQHHLDAVPERQRGALRAAFGLADPGGDDRFLICLGVLSLLADVAEQRPLICLIDDAQWLDGPSADALTFAGRRLDAEGIVLLFAARDDERRTFVGAGLPELRLAGLDAAAAQAVLSEGLPVVPHVRDLLVAATAGNPLALRELPAALTVDQLAGRAPLPGRLPVGAAVERVFLAQVRRQPAPTQTLLLLVAAEDTGDLSTVLAAAQRLGVPAEALDAAETAGLVDVEAGSIAFRHPLVRSAVYRGATFLQRRAAGEALAAVLDGEQHSERRAWQLAATAVGPDDRLADELARIAEQARRRNGHAAAATAYERAAELTVAAEAGARRRHAAARAAWSAGQAERALGLLARAGDATDPHLRGEMAYLRGSIELACGTPLAAQTSLLAGVDLIADSDPPLAATMLAEVGRIAWLGGDLACIRDTGRRLAALPAPGGGAATVTAKLVIGLSRFLHGDQAGAAEMLRAVAATAEQIDDPTALTSAAGGALFVGDDARAATLYARSTARARADGAANALPWLLAPMASLEMWTGRYAAATANATEGLRLASETGQLNPAAHHHGVLAWIAAVQGREQDCREAATAALDRAIPYRLGPQAAIAGWALALLDLTLGRPAEAFQRLDALSRAGPGEGHQMVNVFAAADLVEAAARSAHSAEARTALARLEQWTAQSGVPWASALVERCHALLTDGDDAAERYERALARHTGGGRPFDTARTELAFGEMLRRRRRRSQARIHLRAAYETFERLGAGPWAAKARAELRATGETAHQRDAGTIDRLTPQELQIVRLVGDGGTNREVAAQLFLSPRTVDYHLHKIFTKLGMSSRAELVRLAARDGLA